MSKRLLSRGDARANFDAQGLAVTEWANAQGFKPEDVYSVLSGRTKGRRGQAHLIAVALGLKSTTIVTPENSKPDGIDASERRFAEEDAMPEP